MNHLDPNTVCRLCPACGYDGFTKLKAKGLTLVKPRQCDKCGQQYRPPTSKPVAIVVLVLGLLFATPGLIVTLMMAPAFINASSGGGPNPLALFCPVGFLVVGAVLAYGSFDALREKPVEPPSYKPAKPTLYR
ncbi:MAG: hypothetical protein AAGK09_08290 [Planctomycetota bacterium]